MHRWRLILGDGSGTGPLGGPLHMAIDHALLDGVRAQGRPALRLYGWRPACLSLGRNQRARGVFDAGRAAARGLDVVRRPTGGRAVLHDRELTYAVAAPIHLLDGPRAGYRTINRALVAALRGLRVDAELALDAPTTGPDAPEPCFRRPAAGEVVVGGRKLVGSAQRCERGALLQHGSLLLEGTQQGVTELRTDAGEPIAVGGETSLHVLLGRVPEWALLVEAITAGFEETCGIRLAPGSLTAAERDRALHLEERYRSGAWTWRR